MTRRKVGFKSSSQNLCSVSSQPVSFMQDKGTCAEFFTGCSHRFQFHYKGRLALKLPFYPSNLVIDKTKEKKIKMILVHRLPDDQFSSILQHIKKRGTAFGTFPNECAIRLQMLEFSSLKTGGLGHCDVCSMWRRGNPPPHGLGSAPLSRGSNSKGSCNKWEH